MEKLRRKFEISKSGFTLAEVLMTLVIVGVVAAFTIPTVINTYVESSTVAKVKKGLSILGQAKKLAEAQNGSIEGWDFSDGATAENAEKFWNYVKPYFSIVKDCGFGHDCYQSDGVYLLKGNKWDINFNISTSHYYYKFILADGSVMWLRTAIGGRCADSDAGAGVNNICAMFWYDVNGIKKPNTFGKDVFRYAVTVNGVYPDMNNDCNKNSNGWGCAGYIIKHNNMDYLH